MKAFKEACEKANVKPSKRQLKKWKRKKGIAFKVFAGVAKPLTSGHMHQ